MRIVLDTNVILSALTAQGLSSRVFGICLDKHSLYISEAIINEISKNLKKKFKVENEQIEKTLNFLNRAFINSKPEGSVPNICRDNDDNPILHLADFAKADFIITGDNDLLDLKKYKNTRIITPRIFMDEHTKVIV